MALLDPKLWPVAVGNPVRRLLVGVIGAPILLTGVVAVISFLIAGASEETRAATMAVTEHAVFSFSMIFLGFSLTIGLVGVLVLLAFRQRGLLAWAGMGSLLAAATVAALTTLDAGRPDLAQAGIAAVVGVILFLLIRALSGLSGAVASSE